MNENIMKINNIDIEIELKQIYAAALNNLIN